MQWITDIVNGLVERYETSDVLELCDFLNIEIIKKTHNKDIKSYFFRGSFGNEFIYLNHELDPREERALIAHELGHAILHTDIGVTYYSTNKLLNKCKLESQADYFATKLLTFNIDVHDYSWEGQTIAQLAEEIEIYEPILEGIV
jgi:Zn-dependent peptidase ImmA (M78 family)